MNGQTGNLDEVFRSNGIKKVEVNVNDTNNNLNIIDGSSTSDDLVKN